MWLQKFYQVVVLRVNLVILGNTIAKYEAWQHRETVIDQMPHDTFMNKHYDYRRYKI